MDQGIEPTGKTQVVAEHDPLETGRHDLPVSAALETFVLGGWGEPTPFEVLPLAPGDRTAGRRERLSATLPGERLVVPAGRPTRRGNGQDLRFRAASDFVYLTGNGSAGGVLVLEPDGGSHAATLYLDPPSGRDDLRFFNDYHHGELWVGRRPSLDDVEAALGLRCRPLGDLKDALGGAGPTRVLRGHDVEVDALVPATETFPDRELRAVLSELRLVKDAWEVEQIEAAVAVTMRGFEDVARALAGGARRARPRSGVSLAGAARWKRLRVQPDRGWQARMRRRLHWTRNDGPLRAGDLLLLDAGAESRSLYAADLTRTYPVSGTFSPRSGGCSSCVNDAHEAALAAVRPGRPFRDFRYAVAAVMAHGLADWGLVSPPTQRAGRFPPAFHDLRARAHARPRRSRLRDARAATYLDGVLEPGHVFTVEPGLYFQADDLTLPEELRGIGVRVEDDVVVTEDG